MNNHSANNMLRSGRYLLPNLMTTFNLICGLLAILLMLEEFSGRGEWFGFSQPTLASWLILAAMLFDFLDGKVARWTHAMSEFGVKIDSLTDFVSFGIAPVVIAYGYLLQDIPFFFRVLPCGFYLFGGAWRLARYNIETQTIYSQNFFSGLPIPAAAAFICSIVLVSPGPEGVVPHFLGRSFASLPPAVASGFFAFILMVLAGLMISRIPFTAFKKINQRNLMIFLGMGIFSTILLLVLPLGNIIFLIMLLYLIIGLFQSFLDRVLQLPR